MIHIKEIHSGKDLKKFTKFPTWLYKNSSFYVHPLNADEKMMFSKKNPSAENVEVQCFLAFKGKQVVGRIAAIIHHLYNEKTGKKYVRFSRFDFIDKYDVSEALVEAATRWAKERGMELIHGPLGFSDFDKQGLLVEGFDRLSTFETIYNYGYYHCHLEKLGFKKEFDWLEFEIKNNGTLDQFEKIAKRMVDQSNLTILPQSVSVDEILAKYEGAMFDLINDCYSHLNGYVQVTPKVQSAIIKQFRKVLKREYVALVFDGDKLVGLTVAVPSIARSVNKSQGRMRLCDAFRIMREAKRSKYLDFCNITVSKAHRNMGINAILMNEIMQRAVKNGIVSAETNLELEENGEVLAQNKYFEKQLIKRRRCLIKEI